jgi:CubicO group peptidase (beta-lactamase class C family)
MARHIFEPLGIDHATFDPARGVELGLARGYAQRRGQVVPPSFRCLAATTPAGMLLASSRDVGKDFVARSSMAAT